MENNFLVMFRKREVPFRPMRFLLKKAISQSKRYISLLSFSDKTFERLFYDSMFKSFTKNSLISQNQSDYKPRALVLTSSCLLYIKSTNLLMAVNKFDLYS